MFGLVLKRKCFENPKHSFYRSAYQIAMENRKAEISFRLENFLIFNFVKLEKKLVVLHKAALINND